MPCQPIVADRLRDREDVRFGERAAQRRAAMTAGAEADALRGIIRIRPPAKYARSSRPRSTNISFGAGLPASGDSAIPSPSRAPDLGSHRCAHACASLRNRRPLATYLTRVGSGRVESPRTVPRNDASQPPHYPTGQGLACRSPTRIARWCGRSELAGAGHVENGLARPLLAIPIEGARRLVGLQIGFQIGKVHVMVAVRQQRVP